MPTGCDNRATRSLVVGSANSRGVRGQPFLSTQATCEGDSCANCRSNPGTARRTRSAPRCRLAEQAERDGAGLPGTNVVVVGTGPGLDAARRTVFGVGAHTR